MKLDKEYRSHPVENLKKELIHLLDLQSLALDRASNFRITAEEEKEIEDRYDQIRALLNRLRGPNETHES